MASVACQSVNFPSSKVSSDCWHFCKTGINLKKEIKFHAMIANNQFGQKDRIQFNETQKIPDILFLYREVLTLAVKKEMNQYSAILHQPSPIP